MRRVTALAVLAAASVLSLAPAAGAAVPADREDPIPASVGPANVRGFYVNPETPPGYDSARWVALVQRALRRWGDTFLGFTSSSSQAHTDGQNTIGFAFLNEGQLGVTSAQDNALLRSLPRVEQCSDAAVPGTADVAAEAIRRVKFRMRRDLIRKGRVRRRTITRSAERRSESVASSPLVGRQCVTGPGVDVSRLTVREVDISFGRNPGPYFWDLGPAYPADTQVDLEETVLHELGHAHGLTHQLAVCDVTTPMRASIPSASWWRGQDEAAWSDCPSTTMTPGDSPPEPGSTGATPLAGITVFANSTLAGGLDPERFARVVEAVVTRLGGTFGGTTSSAPGDPDGVSVVGLAPVFGNGLVETSNFPLTTLLTVPAHGTCIPNKRAFTIRVLKRASIRRRLRGRRVTLRRDHFVNRQQQRTSYACADQPEATTTVGTGTEVDVRINDRYAYEFGPPHPLLGTRYDLETAVLAGLLGATGSPRSSDACATGTPVAPLMPGDWWRGPADVSRAQCHRTDGAVAAQTLAAGRPRARRSLLRVR
ncbi:MAG: hypothetical protein QOI98_198 [Solirubrobacteraceae bacterium]|nr:hypothetical protein [Solirubrobacteraceae bacterium]